jgi:hypothetical protein
MTGLTIATVLHAVMMATGSEAETYAEAYQEAMAGGTPMVIFVSTDWCAPCQQMKKHVLPEIRRQGTLSKVVFATVNPDRERVLARALIGGGPVPQLLMFRSTRSGWLRRRLAAVGRTALSNYLFQSIICTFIFYGYGLALFGQVGRATLMALVVGIWVLQLIISPLWMSRFRFGPVEWLWRTLTYLKPQPMRTRERTS